VGVFLCGGNCGLAATRVPQSSRSDLQPKIDADLSVYRHLRSTEGTIQAEKSRPNIQEIAGFQNRDSATKTSNRIWNIKAKATPKYEQYNSESE